ncbi:GIY-YIG nuclease family protein [Candidatus Azambacteria bacterium]|nr:GIY-YIG nuclease family protein [Candidatus Azambacteria bacterium]
MERLKAKLKAVPQKPGVYFFKDKADTIIYIGKALVLRARVRQYFTKIKGESPKTEALRTAIRAIGWKVCGSEIDALIEEAKLIKKHHPRFNVIFRDDKNYAYACATNEKPYPRIFITHQPTKIPTRYSLCVGPFTDAFALRYTVRMLRAAYPYCAARPLSLKRACFDYHLGRCTGACADPKMYVRTEKNISAILHILSGARKGILGRLEKAMKKSARKEEFTKANEYKHRIEYLKKVFAHGPSLDRVWRHEKTNSSEWPLVQEALQKLLGAARDIHRVEGYDISNISGKFAVGSMVVCENGFPAKSQYRKFRIQYSGDMPNDPKMMAEVISRRLRHAEWPAPDVILLDGGKGQLGAVMRVLPKTQLVMALAKENEEIYFAKKSRPVRAETLGKPFLFFVQRLRDEAHRFAITYHRKLRGRIL